MKRFWLLLLFGILTTCAWAQGYWDAYAPERVFTTQEQPYFTVSGVGSHRLEVRVYTVNESKVERHALGYLYAANLKGKPIGQPRIVNLQPPSRRQTYYAKDVYLPRLPAGMYVVQVSDGRGRSRAMLISVSDIGLVVKYASSGNVAARVVRLTDGKGVPGATVALYWQPKKDPDARTSTDASGLANLAIPSSDSGMVWAFWGAHRAAAYVSLGETTPYLQYLFTDRPVYRPAQKVYYKGIVRERVENDYRVPPFESARVALIDPEDKQIAEQEVRINERGTFSGEFNLPSELPLGGYSFRVTYLRDGQEVLTGLGDVAGGFEVQEYRKPEFRLKLEPAQEVYLRGETVTFRLQADYYFGAPVAQATVKYYIYKRFLWGEPWWEDEDEYRDLYMSEDEEELEYGGYGELLEQGETTTNQQGEAFIRIRARAHAEPCSYAVEVEVTDLSLRTEEASASADVYPAAVRLDWRTDNWWVEPGQTAQFTLRATHPRTKQPLAMPVRVAAYRVRWVRLKGNQWKRQDSLLWTRTLRTGTQGQVNVELTPPSEGEYLLRASATDGQGRSTQSEQWVSVFTSSYRGETLGARQTLEVSLDRKTYRPGQQARVLIRSSVPDAEVWLTLEGRKVFGSQVVRLRNGVGVVELPAEWQYAPNAYVCANLVNRKTLIRVQKLFRVTPQGKILQVEVVPDKERYLPDEEATYTIRTRDDEGKPVSAEVALGVVDEAIYAIVPDYTPDIRRFFWGASPNAVATSVSFGREYAAGAAKETAAGEMDEEIRRRFEDTAFWGAHIVTDSNGEAQVRFKMPENLTQWRATARAVTADTAVGTVRSYVRTFKPLLVRLQIPRFLTQGDRVVVSGVVHNYTESSQTVQVSLRVEGAVRTVEGGDKTVTLPPQGQTSVDWVVQAGPSGEAVFTLTARSASEFDGMELRAPVYPRGIPRTIASASVVSQSVEKRFKLSPTRIPGSTSLTVRVAPSWSGTAIGALDDLLVYPYGCIEQTVHPMLTALRVLEVMNALGVEDATRREQATEAIRRGIVRLSENQFPDGSWGYTENSPSNVMWTALALDALRRAKSAGFDVSQGRLNRGLNALYRLLADIPSEPPVLKGAKRGQREVAMARWVASLNEKAHALHTAAQIAPEWARRPLLRLYAVRQHLGTSSQCALAMALAVAKQSAEAKRLQGEIASRAIQTPTTAFWREVTPAMRRQSPWGWYAQDTYATAWAVRMLTATEPRHPLIPKALRWLSEKRQGDYWYSTNDSAQIIMALVEYAQRMPEAVRGPHRVRITVNGQLVRELEYRAEQWLQPEEEVQIPASFLREGENVLRIEHEGSGEIVTSMSLRYFEPAERVQATTQQMRVERTYLKRVPRQLSLKERQQLRRRYGDESEYLWTLVPAKGVFKPGEQLVVKLVIHCATDIYYGVIDDPKPAGFEFVERPEDEYEWSYWYSSREVRDDRVAFLSTFIQKGKNVITYTLRAERPGQVRARPTQAFGMYLPEVNGSSLETSVRTERR